VAAQDDKSQLADSSVPGDSSQLPTSQKKKEPPDFSGGPSVSPPSSSQDRPALKVEEFYAPSDPKPKDDQ